jgi:hypothetical protein
MSIYLPGRGVVSLRVTALDRAAREYDERLRVGKNEQTGDWCVFIQMERGTFPPNDLYPLFGMGPNENALPEPHELKKKLYETDTVRHGTEILDRMNRENAELKRQQEKGALHAQELAAEAYEWGLRRMSNDITKRRIQVNMGESVKHRRPEQK